MAKDTQVKWWCSTHECYVVFCDCGCKQVSESGRTPSPELLPVESMALVVALAQVRRGEVAHPNVATACIWALARLAGRHDWTEEGPEL